jgi:hypothetical protein
MSVNDIADELDSLAHRVVHESGAVRSCPIHPEVWILCENYDAERKAYAYMTNILKKEWGDLGWRDQAMAAVKDKLDWAAEGECPSCASNMAK